MRRHLVGTVTRALAVAAIAACCTGRSSSPPSTRTPAPSAPTPSAPAPVTVTAEHVAIAPPPDGGTLRVRGVYPKHPSRCVYEQRATFDGRYPGVLQIRTADDGSLTVSVRLSFERYLDGLAEVPRTWPMAALEAQVIAARGFALATTGWSGKQGATLETPICGTDVCQVYGGLPTPRPPGLQRWYAAVRNTSGQVLLYGGRPADTVYFSTSNGHTYGNEVVFGSAPLPYLRPVIERDDGASPESHWRVALPFRDLATMLGAAGLWPPGTPIASAAVSGSTVRLTGAGHSATIGASDVRDAANAWGSCLLPRRYPTGGLPITVPSGWFTMATRPGALVLAGRGWGHGVGMVQWGAYGKAKKGWSAARILSYYYGGFTPQPYPEPGTITVVVATGLRSLTVDPSGAGASLDGRTLPRAPLGVQGGRRVTVTVPG